MFPNAPDTTKIFHSFIIIVLCLIFPLQYKHSAQGTQVIHVSLHPGFHRDDLFRLLHINGLLVPAPDEKGEELDEQRKISTIQSR